MYIAYHANKTLIVDLTMLVSTRGAKLKLRSTEETEGRDFRVEGNVLLDVLLDVLDDKLLDVLDDKLLDVTHNMSVRGHQVLDCSRLRTVPKPPPPPTLTPFHITRMAYTDALEKAWCAFADANTMEEGRRAFDAAMSKADRAMAETTKAQELERPRPNSLPPPWCAVELPELPKEMLKSPEEAQELEVTQAVKPLEETALRRGDHQAGGQR